MATLMLSAVGTALGGPIGGALGGLVGQSIDQAILGPAKRRGPKLGDLAIQSSSYGTQIPRIFGTMRIAGSVIWATDLKQEEAIDGGGKGSPGRPAYSYSANLAVALSARPVREVRRIWADGKLIRGASGDFKVRTSFRLIEGSEDQPADPLIASVETIGLTPAYRGIALAIFEDLDLSEFGNRIPLLSFEIICDNGPVTAGQILAECSGGLIETGSGGAVAGFAAYGSSIKDSVLPLVELFGIDLADADGKMSSPPGSAPVIIADEELGCGAGEEPGAKVDHDRVPASALPASRTLTYYDVDRDFQTGQMRASSGGAGSRDERSELPAVVAAGEAKLLVEQGLLRRLVSADTVRISLPPARLGLRPGDKIILPGSVRALVIQRVTINGMAVEVEANPAVSAVPALPADPGRPVVEPDLPVGRTELSLFELPATGNAPEAGPKVLVAGSNQGQWKPVPIEPVLASEPLDPGALYRRATLGRALSALPARVPSILDELSAVTIQLVDPTGILLNADTDALMAGANSCVLGEELIQFGRAEQIGPGTFRLTKLLRGRRGTEWSVALHAVGEPFMLFNQGAAHSIELPPSAVGAIMTCTAFGVGDGAPQPQAQRTIAGEAMRPPSPCHLKLLRNSDGLQLSWVRRSHNAWAWADGVDAGSDPFPERYRVRLAGPGGQLEVETAVTAASFGMAEIPAGPGENLQFGVATVGAMALSREAIATLAI